MILKKDYKIPFLFLLAIALVNCNNSKFQETPFNQFEGTWELEGRKMFEGIQIEIFTDSTSDNLKGNVVGKNNNKYIEMLVDSGDTWVSEISRKSNFKFKLTEKKIGGQLFSLYGQSTSTKYNVQFIDKNTFGISTKGNPEKSSILYKRIK